MALPHAPQRLSEEMAAAVGHAVSAFGYLEETLKRAIFSLTRQQLGRVVDERSLQAWLRRIEDIADDSLGTLIDTFLAAARQSRVREREGLAVRLQAIRLSRNLLCHASWRAGTRPGYWHPTFINTRGERYPDDLDAAGVIAIHDETLEVARVIVDIMQGTGIDGRWAGFEETD